MITHFRVILNICFEFLLLKTCKDHFSALKVFYFKTLFLYFREFIQKNNNMSPFIFYFLYSIIY